jgi:hypothetical protein
VNLAVDISCLSCSKEKLVEVIKWCGAGRSWRVWRLGW